MEYRYSMFDKSLHNGRLTIDVGVVDRREVNNIWYIRRRRSMEFAGAIVLKDHSHLLLSINFLSLN